MIFRQLLDYETFTYTYFLADPDSKQALIIDPVLERAERDLELLAQLDLQLTYILETHCHADHITGAAVLKEATGGFYMAGEKSGIETLDQQLEDGDVIEMGPYQLKVITTPGHTSGCVSFYVDNKVFTGDALFVRGCGRTDFQEGSPETLFSSIRDKIFKLPDQTLVYPGHDYNGQTVSTVGEEKKWNPRLKEQNSLSDFSEIMNGLNLSYPKKIKEALPKNIRGGL